MSTNLTSLIHSLSVWATFWILFEIGVLIAFVLLGISQFKVCEHSRNIVHCRLTMYSRQLDSTQMAAQAGPSSFERSSFKACRLTISVSYVFAHITRATTFQDVKHLAKSIPNPSSTVTRTHLPPFLEFRSRQHHAHRMSDYMTCILTAPESPQL